MNKQVGTDIFSLRAFHWIQNPVNSINFLGWSGKKMKMSLLIS